MNETFIFMIERDGKDEVIESSEPVHFDGEKNTLTYDGNTLEKVTSVEFIKRKKYDGLERVNI